MRVLELKNVLKSKLLTASILTAVVSIAVLSILVIRDAPRYFGDFLTVKPASDNLFSFDKFRYQLAKDSGQGDLASVLAAETKSRNLKFGVGVPSFIKSTLDVEGLTNLTGGIQTNFLDFLGTGEIRNLGNMDDVTKNKLEERLNIGGEIIAVGLKNAVVGSNVIDDDNIVDNLNYTGNLNLAGEWQINGETVTASAPELNLLSGLTSLSIQLAELTDVTSEEGGIYYSDGSSFVQDAENFYYDAGNVALGIGTNSPDKTLHVVGNFEVTEDVTFNGVTYNWPSSQGGANYVLANNGSGTLPWENYSIPDDSLDYDKFKDAMTVDAATTINLYNGTGNVSLRHYNSNTSAEVLFLDGSGSGNVGIGTINPTTKLHVVGNATVTGTGSFASGNFTVSSTGNLQVQPNYGLDTKSAGLLNLGSSNATSINLGNALTSIDVTAMTYDVNDGELYVATSGNVGIGTTAPAYLLDVNGDVRIVSGSDLVLEGEQLRAVQLGDRTYTENNFVTNLESLTGSVDALDIALYSLQVGESGVWRDAGGYIYPQDATNTVIMDTTGFIGIGTTNPATALEVLGEIRGTRFAFQDSSNSYIDTLSTDIISFATGGADRVVIDSVGNLGIGTTGPGQLLTVNGAMRLVTSATPGAPVSGDLYNSGSELNYYDGTQWIELSEQLWTLHSNGTDIFYDVGNVGIGTTAPSANFEVLGANSNQFILGYDNSNLAQFDISSGGDLTITPSGADIVFASTVLTQINSANTAFSVDQLGAGDILDLKDNGSSVVTVIKGGNVGIGTTAPISLLEVSGGNILLDNSRFLDWYDSGGSAGNVLGVTSTDNIVFGDIGGNFDNLMFMTAGQARMLIQQDGNIGIGTTAPGELLSISEEDDTDIVDVLAAHTAFTGDVLTLRANEETDGSFFFLRLVADADGVPTDVLTIGADGSVTIADGALVDLSAIDMSDNQEGLIIPQSTDCGNATQDGQICWDTDNDNLYMGQGASAVLLTNLAITEWTQSNFLLYPNTSTDNLGIGGNTEPGVDILLNSDGSAIFNQQGNDADFRIDSMLQPFLFFVDAGLNFVGIGTSTPSDKFSVAGAAIIGSNYANAGNTAPANGLLIEGNVGIGMTNPAYKLDINGDARIALGSDLYIGGTGLNDNGLAASGAALVGVFDDSFDNIASNTTVQGAFADFDANIGSRTYTNDNVLTDSQSVTSSLNAIDTAIGNRSYTQDNFIADAQILTLSLDALDIALGDIETGVSGLWRDAGAYIYSKDAQNTVVRDGGNIGIGTTNPTAELEVIGDIKIALGSDLYIGATGLNDNAGLASGASLIGLYDNGYANVSANTTVQGAIADIDLNIGPRTYTNDYVVADSQTISTSINALDTGFGNRSYTNDNYVTDGQNLTLSIDALDTIVGNIETGVSGLWRDAVGYIYSSNAATTVIQDSTGNIGIGITSPTEKLQVAGNILINSTYDLSIGGTGLNDNAGLASGASLIGLYDNGYANVSANTTVQGAIADIDSNIGPRTYTNDYVVADSQTISTSINALDTGFGNRTYTNDNYVTDGQNLTLSIDALDTIVGNIETGVSGLWRDAVGYIYSSNAATTVIQDSTGNIGIGITSPTEKLQVAGNILINSTYDLSIGGTGLNDNAGLASGASLIGLYDNGYANVSANTTVQGAIADIDLILEQEPITNDYSLLDNTISNSNLNTLDAAFGNQTHTVNDNYVTDGQDLTLSIDALDTIALTT